jgi:transcriptional regulator with XRE-family HTH domain
MYTIFMDQDSNKTFFIQMGARLAQFRLNAGMTQKQLAENVGLAQQLIAAYEKGTRRPPASLLEPISKALYVSVEDLLGIETELSKKRGPISLVQKKIEQIEQLPVSQRKSLLDTIDNYLKANQTDQ